MRRNRLRLGTPFELFILPRNYEPKNLTCGISSSSKAGFRCNENPRMRNEVTADYSSQWRIMTTTALLPLFMLSLRCLHLSLTAISRSAIAIVLFICTLFPLSAVSSDSWTSWNSTWKEGSFIKLNMARFGRQVALKIVDRKSRTRSTSAKVAECSVSHFYRRPFPVLATSIVY